MICQTSSFEIITLHADVSDRPLCTHCNSHQNVCVRGSSGNAVEIWRRGRFIALTHVGLECLGFTSSSESNRAEIEQRCGRLKQVSQFATCEATECCGTARSSWPWASSCRNRKVTLESSPGDGDVEILDALHNEAIS